MVIVILPVELGNTKTSGSTDMMLLLCRRMFLVTCTFVKNNDIDYKYFILLRPISHSTIKKAEHHRHQDTTKC